MSLGRLYGLIWSALIELLYFLFLSRVYLIVVA